jgi:hypothetical protein
MEYYDSDWKKCNYEKMIYFITLEVSTEEVSSGDMKNIKVTLEKSEQYPFMKKNSNEPIICFETKKFFPNFLIGG